VKIKVNLEFFDCMTYVSLLVSSQVLLKIVMLSSALSDIHPKERTSLSI